MLRRITILFILLLSIPALFACSRMQSVHYVGEKNPMFKEMPNAVGIWKHDDEVFHVKALDDFTAVASTLKWDKDRATFKTDSREIMITKLNDHTFLNVKEGGLYTILRMGYSFDDHLVLYTVRDEKIEEDIRKGTIKVRKSDDKNTYILDLSKKELDAYISANMNELFDFDNVGIITPIKMPEEETATAQDKPKPETGKQKTEN